MRYVYLLLVLLAGVATVTPAVAGWSTHSRTIVFAAEQVDMDATSLATLAHIESRFQAKATTRKSTAGGLVAITNPTWRYLVRKYGPQLGVPQGASKYNPRYNALMAAAYFQENKRYLQANLRTEITDSDAWMGYFFGPDNARRLLDSYSHGRADRVLPSIARSHPSYFYTSSGKARTAREVRTYMREKFRAIGSQYHADVESLLART